jgi:hypothetical protein
MPWPHALLQAPLQHWLSIVQGALGMRQAAASGAAVSSTSAWVVPTEEIANTPANAKATLRIVFIMMSLPSYAEFQG